MRTINLILGLILGFIIGLLSAVTSASLFALWVYSDTKKKPLNRYSTGYKTPKQDKSKPEEDPFAHEYISRAEAEEVLDFLIELITENGFATVLDLKIALQMRPHFEDSKKGWKSLRDASITRKLYQTSAYVINFPDTIDI